MHFCQIATCMSMLDLHDDNCHDAHRAHGSIVEAVNIAGEAQETLPAIL